MKTKILYFEIIAGAIALASTRVFGIGDTLPMVVYTLVMLAYSMLCFLISMTKFNASTQKEKIDNFVHRMSWLALSVLAVGILYRVQHYPGAGVMNLAGEIAGALALIYHLFNITNDKKNDKAITSPLYDPNGSRGVINIPCKANKSINSFLFKYFGEKYSHLEMSVRLAIAIAIALRLYFFIRALDPYAIPDSTDM